MVERQLMNILWWGRYLKERTDRLMIYLYLTCCIILLNLAWIWMILLILLVYSNLVTKRCLAKLIILLPINYWNLFLICSEKGSNSSIILFLVILLLVLKFDFWGFSIESLIWCLLDDFLLKSRDFRTIFPFPLAFDTLLERSSLF